MLYNIITGKVFRKEDLNVIEKWKNNPIVASIKGGVLLPIINSKTLHLENYNIAFTIYTEIKKNYVEITSEDIENIKIIYAKLDVTLQQYVNDILKGINNKDINYNEYSNIVDKINTVSNAIKLRKQKYEKNKKYISIFFIFLIVFIFLIMMIIIT